MKRSLVFLLFLFCCFQGTFSWQASQIDSLKALIAQTENDSLKMEYYNELRKRTVRTDISEAMTYNDQYLQLAKELELKFKEALGHAYKGNLHVRLAEYPEAIEELIFAIKYFEATNDSIRMASTYNSIGAAYEHMGNDSLTLIFFQKTFDIASALNDSRRMVLSLNNMSNVAVRAENFEKSEGLLAEAIRLSEGQADLKDYYVISLLNSANTKLELGKFAEGDEMYQQLLKHPNAQSNYLRSLSLKGAGNAKLRQKAYTIALSYLSEAYEMVNTFNFISLKADVLENLSEAYEGVGNTKLALAHFKSFYAFQDSVLTKERREELNDAIQRFEAEKKDKEIQAKQVEIKTQEVKLRNMGLLLLAAAAVLAIGLLLFYIRNRDHAHESMLFMEKSKLQELEIEALHKEKQLISMQSILAGQEEERHRIARDLHDNIGSMMAAIKVKVMTIQDNIKALENMKIGEQLDDMVGQVSEEVRRISHNMTPLSFGLSGLSGALEDLAQQLKREHIVVDLSLSEIDELENKEQAIMVYRICQELVNNIIKHSEATWVGFAAKLADGVLSIKMEDNGVGLTNEAWKEGKNLGLRSIRSRVDYLGGDLELNNTKGTRFLISIPLIVK